MKYHLFSIGFRSRLYLFYFFLFQTIKYKLHAESCWMDINMKIEVHEPQSSSNSSRKSLMKEKSASASASAYCVWFALYTIFTARISDLWTWLALSQVKFLSIQSVDISPTPAFLILTNNSYQSWIQQSILIEEWNEWYALILIWHWTPWYKFQGTSSTVYINNNAQD